MTPSRHTGHQILQRIADALGTDVAALSDERAGAQSLHETLELLTAFERIVDRHDRRACLDFVRSVAEPERDA